MKNTCQIRRENHHKIQWTRKFEVALFKLNLIMDRKHKKQLSRMIKKIMRRPFKRNFSSGTTD